MILAIDPGPVKSAWVLFDGQEPRWFRYEANDRVKELLKFPDHDYRHVVIEDIRGYGMKVGNDVFETCRWIGRFEVYAKMSDLKGPRPEVVLLPRKDITETICDNRSAGDSDVRKALIAMYGGQEAAIGTKKKPGPLYGITGDVWAALAVAVAAQKRGLA